MTCKHKPAGNIDTGFPATSLVQVRTVLPAPPAFMDKSVCSSVARIYVFVKLCPKISALCCDDVRSQ